MKLLALIKKEFLRFFRDPRLVISMLLPGVILFAIYSVMGSILNKDEEKQYEFKVYLAGESAVIEQIETIVEFSGHTIEWLTVDNAKTAKSEVKSGKVTAYIAFSEDFDYFDQSVVEIYFASASDESSTFYALSSAVLEQYGMRFTVAAQTVSDDADFSGALLASLLPFLIVVMIFSSSMSVTLESVAGEKERGTLATILVTSVKRSHLALGKIISLSCIAMLGAISSFLGVVLSLPRLAGVSFGVLGGYGFLEYLLLFLLTVSVVPLIISAISAVSTVSKSVKEAAGYTSVIMILVMMLSLITVFVTGLGDWAVALPALNAVVVMQKILGGAGVVWQSLVSLGVNLLYTAGLVFVIARMFSSEKIMFNK